MSLMSADVLSSQEHVALESEVVMREVRLNVCQMFEAYLQLTSEGFLLHGTVLGFVTALIEIELSNQCDKHQQLHKSQPPRLT